MVESIKKKRKLVQNSNQNMRSTATYKNDKSFSSSYQLDLDVQSKEEQNLLRTYLNRQYAKKEFQFLGYKVDETTQTEEILKEEKNTRYKKHEVSMIRSQDKLSFTLGVLILGLCEYVILKHPEYFHLFYIPLMVPIMIYRYFDFKESKYELFLLDFCYFTNISVAIQVLFFPNNLIWFQVNYVACLGPISIAMVFWQNSVVFHSLDKMTSFFVHAFPPVAMHLFRWKIIPNDLPLDGSSYLPLYANFVLPLFFYAVWQGSYLIITEYLLQDYLKDPSVINSLRYLLADKNNPIVNFIRESLIHHGIIGLNEELDPNTMLGKSIFVFGQLIYTLITILHVRVLYAYRWIQFIYLIAIFGVTIWNGACYYMKADRRKCKTKLSSESASQMRSKKETNNNSHKQHPALRDLINYIGHLKLEEPEHLELYTKLLESIAIINRKPSRN